MTSNFHLVQFSQVIKSNDNYYVTTISPETERRSGKPCMSKFTLIVKFVPTAGRHFLIANKKKRF